MNTHLLRAQLLIILSLGFISTFAQPGGTTPDQNMISTSQNYGISNIFSSNYFDGTINVSIPIYGYSNEYGNYDVSLSYATKGVLINEISNPAGLNWELVAESSIERIVKDIPDELNVVNGPDSVERYGRIFLNKNKYIKGKIGTYWETPAEKARTNVYRDGECDEFIVTLAGKKFTFYLGQDLTNFTHPKRNVKIQPLLNGSPLYSITNQPIGSDPLSELGFQITDERGNKYIFEVGDYTGQSIYDNTIWDDDIIGSAQVISKWNLKKIIFIDGKEITYFYDHSWEWGYGLPGTHYYNNYFVEETSSGVQTYLGPKGQFTTESFSQLLKIKYPNNIVVDFIYDATNKTEGQRKVLNEITIKDGSLGVNCLKYKFNQTIVEGRSILNSIRTASCDNSLDELYYSFNYNPIPKRLNSGIDFFGYSNGDSIAVPVNGSGNKITIPKHTTDPAVLNYGVSRVYNPIYANAGLLNVIKNSFGGQVRFVYGGNTASITNDLAVPGGSGNSWFVGKGYFGLDGVRVDSIIEKDKFKPNDSVITVIDYHNSGQIFTSGGYVHYPSYIDSTTNQVTKNIFQSMFLTVHQLVNGSNHGYSNVGIKRLTANGSLLSRKEISYTNMRDALSNNLPRFYKVSGSKDLWEYPYTNKQYIKDWEIGLPIEISEYDNNDRIVRKTTNQYEFSNIDLSASAYCINTKTSKVNTGTQITIPQSPGYYPNKKVFTDTYYPYTGSAKLIKATMKKYITDTRFVSDEIAYSFDEKNNLKSVLTTDSKGEKIDTRLIYNYNVDGPNIIYGSANPNTVLYNMSGSDIESVVSMERWNVSGNNRPFTDLLLESWISGFDFTPGKLLKKSTFNCEIGAPITYTQYTGIPTGVTNVNPYSKIIQANNTQNPIEFIRRVSDVTMFDLKGNPLEIKYLGLNKFNAFVYDTITGNKLCEVQNSKYADIGYTSFEDIGTPDYWIVRGNLDLNTTKVINTDIVGSIKAVSGQFIYKLVAPPANSIDFSDILGKVDLNTNTEYVLSFWVNGNGTSGIPKVYIGSTQLANPTAPIDVKGDWTRYQYTFTPTTAAKIKISPLPTGTLYVDEIRLHPSNALMNSFTYEPLFGVSSTVNENGRVTHYEYDKLGRQNIIRDHEGNILQKSKQLIKGNL